MSSAECARNWYFMDGEGCARDGGDGCIGVDVGLGKVLRKRGLFYQVRRQTAVPTCFPIIAMQDIRGTWDIGRDGLELWC